MALKEQDTSQVVFSDQADRDNHRKMLKPYFVIVTRWLLTPKIDTNESLKKIAEARGISEVVVASRGGKTALKIAEAVGKKIHVISITEFSYSDDVKKKMKKLKMAPIENADLVIQDLREMNETLLMFGPGVKTVLEVGTGSGAFLRNLTGAKHAYGLDQSPIGTKIARGYFKDTPNVTIIMQDLMKTTGQFDVVIADQVLHHLPDTYKALERTVSLVKPWGLVMFYVYKKKAPIREFMDNFLRYFTTRLSDEYCMLISGFMLWVGKRLTKISLPLQRWVYWNLFKCFYNESFWPSNNLRVNFDWYSPKIAHRHTEAEVYKWVKNLNLKTDFLHVGESGISVRAYVPHNSETIIR